MIYTVVADDSLWKISENFLGNGAHYHQLIAANPGKLKDEKSVIHPGDPVQDGFGSFEILARRYRRGWSARTLVSLLSIRANIA